jgi:hypothetical protein
VAFWCWWFCSGLDVSLGFVLGSAGVVMGEERGQCLESRYPFLGGGSRVSILNFNVDGTYELREIGFTGFS